MVSANLEYVILAGSLLSRTKRLWPLAASLRYSLCLADTGSSPRPRAGGRRVQLPGEAAFESRSRRSRTYELRASTRRKRVRCAARLHAQHLCPRARTPLVLPSPLMLTYCDFACARLAPRPRSTNAIIACVILAGSLLPRTNLRAQLSALGPHVMLVVA